MSCVYRVTAVLLLLRFIPFVDHLSSAGTHTLQYLYTALTPGLHFPQFTVVGLVDGQQVVYYDRNISRVIPKTEWMKRIEADKRYWESETQYMTGQQDWFQGFVDRAKQRFNLTEGNHTIQWMYGCEYDDDTTRGYDQYSYDGEDFISLNLTTGTWTAVNDKAKSFINDWDRRGTKATHWKNFLENDCIDRLKKFVSYSEMQRKVVPEVSVFQKHSSPSPEVVCHATGFFPKALNITWQKDGEDVHEDVELRETLPHQDGSFQKRSILKVPAEELQKHTYTCVVQHSSLEKELVLNVSERQILRGRGSDGGPDGGLINAISIGLTVLAVLGIIVAGIVIWKKKNSAFKPVPQYSNEALPMKHLPPEPLKV